MKTECPHCRQHYEVDDDLAGEVVTCETCGQSFVLPCVDAPVETPSCPEDGEITVDDNAPPKRIRWGAVVFGVVAGLLAVLFCFAITVLRSEKNRLAEKNSGLQTEIDELMKQNAELQTRLDEWVSGPETMLSDALAAFESSDYDGAMQIMTRLFEQRPGKKLEKRYGDAYEKIRLAYEAETEKKAAEAARKEAAALENMSRNYDYMQEITWYESKSDCEYALSHFLYVDAASKYYLVKLYFGRHDNGTFLLRLRTGFYDATDSHTWIFYEKVQLKGSNGVGVFVETDYPEKQSEVGSGSIREWSDNYVGDQYEQLKKLAESDKIFVKFYGKYPYEFVMTDEQLNAFKETIFLYESMQ